MSETVSSSSISPGIVTSSYVHSGGHAIVHSLAGMAQVVELVTSGGSEYHLVLGPHSQDTAIEMATSASSSSAPAAPERPVHIEDSRISDEMVAALAKLVAFEESPVHSGGTVHSGSEATTTD